MNKISKWQKLRQCYTKWLEVIIVGLLFLTIINVFVDVLLRYVFNNSSIALQELEWHLFSSMFLLGISYTLQQDSHVRVDLIYDKLDGNKKAWINIVGFVLFVIPISLLIVYYGFDFSYKSFLLNEQSGDPGGLSYRFIIKGMMPIGFVLVIISGFIFAKDNYLSIKK